MGKYSGMRRSHHDRRFLDFAMPVFDTEEDRLRRDATRRPKHQPRGIQRVELRQHFLQSCPRFSLGHFRFNSPASRYVAPAIAR